MRQLDDTCIVLAEVAWSFLWLSKIHQDPYLIIFCIYLLFLHIFALSFASPEICEFLQVLWSFELRLSMTFRHLGLVPCLMSDVVLGLQGGPDAWCFRLRRLSKPSRCPGSPFAPDDPVITPTRPVLHCPSLPFNILRVSELTTAVSRSPFTFSIWQPWKLFSTYSVFSFVHGLVVMLAQDILSFSTRILTPLCRYKEIRHY